MLKKLLENKLLGRVAVAAIFIPLLTAIMLLGNAWFILFVEVVIGVSLYEFYSMMEKNGMKVHKKTGMILGLLMPLTYYITRTFGWNAEKFAYLGVVAIVLIFIGRQVFVAEIKNALPEIAYSLFGVMYISLLFSHIIPIKFIGGEGSLFGLKVTQGRLWLLSSFLLVWASDSAAYFVGMNIGKHRLSPKISPKKSIEGAIGGLLAPIVSMFLIKLMYFHDLALIHVVAIGAIVGIFGQVGDLGESLFKREMETKDSGTFLLGHGGMLDRFDSLIFILPVLYYYLKFFVA